MLNHQKTARLTQMASALAVVLGGLSLVPAAHAAAPNAGVNISNIARASYTDGDGNARNTNSNEVSTTVLQVASFTLVQNQTVSSNPNGQVKLYHTLTNTGNASDSFTLNVADVTTSGADDFDFGTIQIFALDAGGNPTGPNLAGQTVTLSRNQALNLVVITTTPATAANGQNGKLTISAASTFTPAVTATNTDTVNVTGNGVITVTKSASYNATTGRVEYTLTVQNIGNTTATAIALNDVLDSRLSYVTNSGVYSGSPSGLTDASDATDKYAVSGQILTFTIDSLAPNTTQTLKFEADVVAGTTAGTIPNKAAFTYDPDGTGPTGTTPSQDSNTATFTIAATYLGTINDSNTDPYADAAAVPGNTAKDDRVETGAPVNPASTSTFDTWVHNTGNTTETYNVTAASLNLPAGSVVKLYKADGVTELTDTNGDGIADTGPVAAGAAVKIVAKVTLPASYNGTSSTTENLDARLTLSPVDNTGAVDTVIVRIVDVLPNTVDLTGNNGGTGPGTPTVIDSVTTQPGAQAILPLVVTNGGTAADNYNLSVSGLPAGWTVTFVENTGTAAAPVCGTTPVTNTGSIAASGSKNYCALVTPAGNAPAGNTDLTFSVTSPVSGLSDTLVDRVTVQTVRTIALVPDRTGQVAPGGTIVYSHTLTNNGNSAETSLPFTLSSSPAVASESLYIDVNNDGQIDAGDTLVTGNDIATALGSSLAAGASVQLLVKVQVPTGVSVGSTYVTTLTVTPTGAGAPTPVTVTDTTTVNAGQVRLEKTQAMDANCDGTIEGSYVTTSLSAKPGECISYQITATNQGSTNVTGLNIDDTVPTYTTLTTPAPSNGGTTGTVSVSGSVVSNNVGTLAPLSSAKLVFSVKVDQ